MKFNVFHEMFFNSEDIIQKKNLLHFKNFHYLVNMAI